MSRRLSGHSAAMRGFFVLSILATFLSKDCAGFRSSRISVNFQSFNKLRLDAAPGPTMARSEAPTVVSADGEVSYDEGEFLYDEDDEDDDFEDDDRDGFERTTRKTGRPLGNNE